MTQSQGLVGVDLGRCGSVWEGVCDQSHLLFDLSFLAVWE